MKKTQQPSVPAYHYGLTEAALRALLKEIDPTYGKKKKRRISQKPKDARPKK